MERLCASAAKSNSSEMKNRRNLTRGEIPAEQEWVFLSCDVVTGLGNRLYIKDVFNRSDITHSFGDSCFETIFGTEGAADQLTPLCLVSKLHLLYTVTSTGC